MHPIASSEVRQGGHLPWIDAARVLAVGAVVAIHVSSGLFGAHARLAPGAWLVADVVFSATRWPVSVLVMVSGYLALGRDEPLRPFYLRRGQRLLVPLIAWSLIYWVYLELIDPAGRDLAWFASASIQGGTYFHLYFLFVITGLAVVTPFLRLIAARGGWTLDIAICLGIGYAFVQRFLLELHLASGSNAFSMFIPYIGIYLLGYRLGAIPSRPRLLAVAAAAAGIAVIGAAWLSLALNDQAGGRWVGWIQAYFGVAGIVETIAVFVLIRAIPAGWTSRPAIRWAGTLAFGVYLIHPIVSGWLGPIIGYPRGAAAATVYILARVAVYVVVSATIVGVMRRLPVLRSIV